MKKAENVKEFVEQYDNAKKVNPKDLSSDQDLTIAIMNLIPFPGLDGWQLLLCIIESITKKPANKKNERAVERLLFYYIFVALDHLIISRSLWISRMQKL